MDNFKYFSILNRTRLIGKIVSDPMKMYTNASGRDFYVFFFNCPTAKRPNTIPISLSADQIPLIEELKQSGNKVLLYGKCESFHSQSGHFYEYIVTLQMAYPYKNQYKVTNSLAIGGEIMRTPQILSMPSGKMIQRFLLKTPAQGSHYSVFSVSVANEKIDNTLWAEQGDKIACKGHITYHTSSETSVLRAHMDIVLPQAQMREEHWAEFNNPDSDNTKLTELFEQNHFKLNVEK